eukprot:TRINITY_DN4058_c0_g1_i11.p1 TRINITY_DN4058_c0_g1~~TRINITY_DN4058_c0_g1_i11.p1  ORF type:complete len:269 (+),score=78.29 TRINITY_DN4058_c0_g1_i11:153-959(+)
MCIRDSSLGWWDEDGDLITIGIEADLEQAMMEMSPTVRVWVSSLPKQRPQTQSWGQLARGIGQHIGGKTHKIGQHIGARIWPSTVCSLPRCSSLPESDQQETMENQDEAALEAAEDEAARVARIADENAFAQSGLDMPEFASAPVPQEVAFGFIAALRREYVHDVAGAVGEYFTQEPGGLDEDTLEQLLEEPYEAAVRATTAPLEEINRIEKEWCWKPEWGVLVEELAAMGFEDPATNQAALLASQGDLKAAVTALVAEERASRRRRA